MRRQKQQEDWAEEKKREMLKGNQMTDRIFQAGEEKKNKQADWQL